MRGGEGMGGDGIGGGVHDSDLLPTDLLPELHLESSAQSLPGCQQIIVCSFAYLLTERVRERT
jgi:hypothetical protein